MSSACADTPPSLGIDSSAEGERPSAAHAMDGRSATHPEGLLGHSGGDGHATAQATDSDPIVPRLERMDTAVVPVPPVPPPVVPEVTVVSTQENAQLQRAELLTYDWWFEGARQTGRPIEPAPWPSLTEVPDTVLIRFGTPSAPAKVEVRGFPLVNEVSGEPSSAPAIVVNCTGTNRTSTQADRCSFWTDGKSVSLEVRVPPANSLPFLVVFAEWSDIDAGDLSTAAWLMRVQ